MKNDSVEIIDSYLNIYDQKQIQFLMQVKNYSFSDSNSERVIKYCHSICHNNDLNFMVALLRSFYWSDCESDAIKMSPRYKEYSEISQFKYRKLAIITKHFLDYLESEFDLESDFKDVEHSYSYEINDTYILYVLNQLANSYDNSFDFITTLAESKGFRISFNETFTGNFEIRSIYDEK